MTKYEYEYDAEDEIGAALEALADAMIRAERAGPRNAPMHDVRDSLGHYFAEVVRSRPDCPAHWRAK